MGGEWNTCKHTYDERESEDKGAEEGWEVIFVYWMIKLNAAYLSSKQGSKRVNLRTLYVTT